MQQETLSRTLETCHNSSGEPLRSPTKDCADSLSWNQQLVERDLKDPGQGGAEGLLNLFSNVGGAGEGGVPADINLPVSVVSATLLPSPSLRSAADT